MSYAVGAQIILNREIECTMIYHSAAKSGLMPDFCVMVAAERSEIPMQKLTLRQKLVLAALVLAFIGLMLAEIFIRVAESLDKAYRRLKPRRA
jgi:hypothetical protein